jgi:hypothetical protein
MEYITINNTFENTKVTTTVTDTHFETFEETNTFEAKLIRTNSNTRY